MPVVTPFRGGGRGCHLCRAPRVGETSPLLSQTRVRPGPSWKRQVPTPRGHCLLSLCHQHGRPAASRLAGPGLWCLGWDAGRLLCARHTNPTGDRHGGTLRPDPLITGVLSCGPCFGFLPRVVLGGWSSPRAGSSPARMWANEQPGDPRRSSSGCLGLSSTSLFQYSSPLPLLLTFTGDSGRGGEGQSQPLSSRAIPPNRDRSLSEEPC